MTLSIIFCLAARACFLSYSYILACTARFFLSLSQTVYTSSLSSSLGSINLAYGNSASFSSSFSSSSSSSSLSSSLELELSSIRYLRSCSTYFYLYYCWKASAAPLLISVPRVELMLIELPGNSLWPAGSLLVILCLRKIQNSRRNIITKMKQNKAITPPIVRRMLPKNLLYQTEVDSSSPLLVVWELE